MFSTALRLATRAAVSRSVAVRSCRLVVRQPQPMFTVTTLRHFSENPPLFLDANDVTERIIEVVKNFDQVDGAKVSPETKFGEDLGLDSLDQVEVVMAIEDEFAIEIPDQEADKITSIADAVEYISHHPMAK